MVRPTTSKSADKLAKSIQRDKAVRRQRQREEKTITEKIARLRALRLAKAASDKELADRADAEKLAAKARKAATKGAVRPTPAIDTVLSS
jgi:hypothetical protein